MRVVVSDTTQPIILGLMAHDKTHWIVEPSPGVLVRRVIVGGYGKQSVSGLAVDATLEVYTHDSSPCPRCIQKQPYFNSYKEVPPQLEEIVGVKHKSFQGRYTGESFSIFQGM